MGATVEDVEACLGALAHDVERGGGHSTDASIGQLAEVVAELLSDGDVLAIRHSAARISVFLKVVVGISVPAGEGTGALNPVGLTSSGPVRPDAWAELAAEATSRAIAAATSALGETRLYSNNEPASTKTWRDEIAGHLTLFLRQLRHVALVQEAANLARQQRDAALTVDDRVLEALRLSGPHRSGDVAARLDIDRAQVSRSLTRLVRLGRARETSSRTEDGRGRWYELSDPQKSRE